LFSYLGPFFSLVHDNVLPCVLTGCKETFYFHVSLFLLGVGPSKKKRKRSQAQSQPKNAVCALNELRPGLIYNTVSMNGPVHAPIFTISVEVGGCYRTYWHAGTAVFFVCKLAAYLIFDWGNV